ncbi:hypothetical protein B0H11DRAFT_1922938 [Mycena galericulata]|nr:hypothetical protein B0H11DRAFT_1922938 [Mycena galericulata]
MSQPTLDIDTLTPPVFTPAFPFDNTSKADAIVRSSDGADFYVHRAILALVSPVFRDMFSLPQPESSPDTPIIPVQEDAVVLDRALRFFYPGAQSVAATLNELRDIIQILVAKYDMQCVVPAAKTRLETHLAEKPVAVYAIAFNHQWKDVALKAARESLKLPLRVVNSEAPPELRDIPASAYHNLLYYHSLCASAAKSVTEALRWVPAPNTYVWFSCGTCEGAKLAWYLSDSAVHAVRIWFNDYLKALGTVLAETPGIDIHDHKTMFDALAVASKCTTCREKAFEQLPRFVSAHLSTKVKAVMDQVQLQM